MQVRVLNMTSLRWIDNPNRLVYRIRGDVLEIISCRGIMRIKTSNFTRRTVVRLEKMKRHVETSNTIYDYISRITLAGIPMTTFPAGTFFVTSALAPTTAFVPTTTPGRRLAPAPTVA